jgi:hypothetical protein
MAEASKPTPLTPRQAIELAYRTGFADGMRKAGKAKVSRTDNRCLNEDCYLARGHQGDHKPWPKIPNITPSDDSPRGFWSQGKKK